MANRLVELALEALESRKTQIESEIKELRSQIRRGMNAFSGRAGSRGRKPGRRSRRGRKRVRTAASRKAQSLRMKEYWAKRRAESASGEAKRR
jgi:hypothetical protein